MSLSAERRSGSEVAEPRWRVTFDRVERVMALGEVEERVKTRTVSLGFAARTMRMSAWIS